MHIFDKFDRGDIVAILKILAVCLLLYLLFGGLDHLLGIDKIEHIETVASISACRPIGDGSFRYVNVFSIKDDVHICGQTNMASMSFDLIISEEKQGVIYEGTITSSARKKLQLYMSDRLGPGKYTVKLSGIKKTYATTEFEIKSK